jgi:hypothetical protein
MSSKILRCRSVLASRAMRRHSSANRRYSVDVSMPEKPTVPPGRSERIARYACGTGSTNGTGSWPAQKFCHRLG